MNWTPIIVTAIICTALVTISAIHRKGEKK